MRIVVDANILFSAILSSESEIAKILLRNKSKLNIYSTDLVFEEIFEHKAKIIKTAKFTENDFQEIILILQRKIRIVDVRLIPKKFILNAIDLLKDIDLNDVEYVALTEHIKGKLWTGDKQLINGLKKLGWEKYIKTQDLKSIITKRLAK